VLPAVADLYRLLCAEEARHGNPREAMAASLPLLLKILQEKQMSYEEWVFSLHKDEEEEAVDGSRAALAGAGRPEGRRP
jgi:hypothetical protein